MSNTIVLKKSAVADKIPSTSQMEIGELAINLADKKLYAKVQNTGTEATDVILISDSDTVVNADTNYVHLSNATERLAETIYGAKSFEDDMSVNGELFLIGTEVQGDAKTMLSYNTDTLEINRDLEFISGTKIYGDTVVDGNLTITGTQTTVNTTDLAVTNNFITLNEGEIGEGVSDPSKEAGISIDRGEDTTDPVNPVPYATADLYWDETAGRWVADQATGTGSTIITEADLTSGTLNLDDRYVNQSGNIAETITGVKTFDDGLISNGITRLTNSGGTTGTLEVVGFNGAVHTKITGGTIDTWVLNLSGATTSTVGWGNNIDFKWFTGTSGTVINGGGITQTQGKILQAGRVDDDDRVANLSDLSTNHYSKTEADAKYLLNTTDTLTGDLTVTAKVTSASTVDLDAGTTLTTKDYVDGEISDATLVNITDTGPTVGDGVTVTGGVDASGNFQGANFKQYQKFGTYGIALGTTSGDINNTVGRLDVFVGNVTGKSSDSTQTSFNTYIGANAASLGSNAGGYNTIIGYRAGENNSQRQNVFVGSFAGANNISGSNTTALGFQAGSTTTDLSNTTSLGYNAEPTQSNQVVLGNTSVTEVRSTGNFQGANIKTDDANNNQFVGISAGSGLDPDNAAVAGDGQGNTAIGDLALSDATYNDGTNDRQVKNCTASGYQAGYLNTGVNLTASGYFAGRLNIGNNVTASGYQAGYQNTGINVTASGYLAGYLNTGNFVTAAGYQAGRSNTGRSVTATGYEAGYLNTGINVTATGAQAGRSNTGFNVTASGFNAGRSNTGFNATLLGTEAGYWDGTAAAANTFDNVSCLGYRSYATADNQVVLGDTNVTEVRTTGTMLQGGRVDDTDRVANLSDVSTQVSDATLVNITDTGPTVGDGVTVTGGVDASGAFQGSNIKTDETFPFESKINSSALSGRTTGTGRNVGFGYKSLENALSIDQCVAIGMWSGRNAKGADSTSVGYEAGGSIRDNCTAIGRAALAYMPFDTSIDCVGVGRFSGYQNRGAGVTLLGTEAGYWDGTAAAANTFDNVSCLGYRSFATADNQVVLGGTDVTEVRTTGTMLQGGRVDDTDRVANLSDIASETSAREAADTTLQNNIDSEAATRLAADNDRYTKAEADAKYLLNTTDTLTGDLTVTGNLTIQGTTTTVQTETVEIDDNIIVLNSNKTGDPDVSAENAGFEVERGTGTNSSLLWDETLNKWVSVGDAADFTTKNALAYESDIAAETSARQSADTTLQNNIDSEASTRAAADTTLQNNINTESTARQNADTTLQNNIDSEAATRLAADNDRYTKTEADARYEPIDSAYTKTEADAKYLLNTTDTLTGTLSVTAKVTSASTIGTDIATTLTTKDYVDAADTTLQNNIDSEASTRATNDTTLQNNINAEAATRAAADTTLQNNIDSEASTRAAADNDRYTKTEADARYIQYTEVTETQQSLVALDDTVLITNATYQSSDERLKENIEIIDDSENIIDNINGYRFDMNGKRQVGVIAQEVQKVLPEVVMEGNDGYLKVNYGNMIAVLIEEVKSLKTRIAELENK